MNLCPYVITLCVCKVCVWRVYEQGHMRTETIQVTRAGLFSHWNYVRVLWKRQQIPGATPSVWSHQYFLHRSSPQKQGFWCNTTQRFDPCEIKLEVYILQHFRLKNCYFWNSVRPVVIFQIKGYTLKTFFPIGNCLMTGVFMVWWGNVFHSPRRWIL